MGMDQKRKKSNGQSLLHETRGVKWKLERASAKYTREEVAAAIASFQTFLGFVTQSSPVTSTNSVRIRGYSKR